MKKNIWVVIRVCLPLCSLFAGCSVHPPIHPDLAKRLPQIRSVAMSTPFLDEYVQSYHLSKTRRIALPESALTNVAMAVRRQFGDRGISIVQEIDLNHSVFAPRFPPWRGDTNSIKVGYGPSVVDFHFEPTGFTQPAPEIGVDAVLFTFGWEMTATGGAIEKKTNPLVLWMVPVELLFDTLSHRPDSLFLATFSRRQICLGLCLTDTHTGEVLWSTIEMHYGSGALTEPEIADKIVSQAYANFAKYLSVE
jgi:hypothetical protein